MKNTKKLKSLLMNLLYCGPFETNLGAACSPCGFSTLDIG